MKKKTSFLLYYSWKSAFLSLPKEEAGELIQEVYRYNPVENNISRVSPSIKIPYIMITEQIKNDYEKYEERCREKSERAKEQWEKKRSDLQ